MISADIHSKTEDRELRKLRRWAEKWGNHKWLYVLFHQLVIILIWHTIKFFIDYDLKIFPTNTADILKVVIREYPILVIGIIFWIAVRILQWESNAFKAGLLHLNGKLPIEGTNPLHMVRKHTEKRILFLNKWHKRWAKRKSLFIIVYTGIFFLTIVGLGILVKVGQKGSAWIDTIFPSPWPVYLLLIGIPLALSIFLSTEIWRRNEIDYLDSLQDKKHHKDDNR